MGKNPSFLASVGSSFAAVLVITAARHQIARALLHGNDAVLLEAFSRRAAFLLYSSWILAIGAAEYLWQSHAKREPESAWPVMALLAVFLYLSLVP